MEPEQQKTKSGKLKWLVLAIVAILVVYWSVGLRNSFVTMTEKANNAWAQIDSQLQRRYDLIPNLVGAVKGNMVQEQKIFGEIAEARSRYAGATNAESRAQAANQVESALSRLLAIVENYPQLQSSQAFRDLMVQLEGTENRIAVARKDYNDSVTVLNARLKVFPNNIVGKIFGFSPKTYFEVPNEAKTNPQVDFTQ